MNENNSLDNRLPFIPSGPFHLRLPFIHYKIEYVEFIQGLILGVTGLSSLPYLTEYLGIPYELAWSCIIIEIFLYTLHCTLGDPVIPGWITPSLPLTLLFLKEFEMGPERIHAMMALQMEVGLIFIIMGVTKMADKFVHAVPNAIKGGILLAAPITVLQGQLAPKGNLYIYPISIIAGVALLVVISFSSSYNNKRKDIKVLDIIAKYGNLFPYLLAMAVGLIVKELANPVVDTTRIIKVPDFGSIITNLSIFGIGLPKADMFVKALPLALVIYVIAFGDLITSETLIKEAGKSRPNEKIDFNQSRSNLVSGLRNILLAIIAPFPPLSGPLWVGMTVSVSMRYKEGKKAMKSLIGGMASFRIATFICVLIVPLVSFFKPLFPVGASITLIFQAFVCARIGMDYCKTDNDKMIAGIMASVLAIKGSAYAIAVGIILCIVLGNSKKIAEQED